MSGMTIEIPQDILGVTGKHKNVENIEKKKDERLLKAKEGTYIDETIKKDFTLYPGGKAITNLYQIQELRVI